MRHECIKAVVAALGRELNQGEAKDIEQRIVRNARAIAQADPKAWMAKPKAQRLTEAGERAAQELIGEARLKAEREALTIAAHARMDSFLSDARARGITDFDALDRKIAFHADGKVPGLSIESAAKAIRNDLLRQLIPVMEASNPKWFGLLTNKDGERAIYQEIFGEDSGNPVAKAGAKIWHEVTGAARERFNAAGGDIGKLDDWGMPHHHSQLRVAKAGRDAWVSDILQKLDRSKYVNEDGSTMNDTQLSEFLQEAWLTIATGGANKLTPGQFKGNGARANRGSTSRQIHFKDAQSYIDYQTQFGERSLYEVLTGHVEGVAKDIALVEELGPNPDQTARFYRDQAVQAAKIADPVNSGKADERAIKSENLYNVVAGRTAPVANEHLANGFDTVRNFLMASRLGGAVISSITDEGTLHLTARLNNLPALRIVANELAALNPANKMEERMAMRAGLALNTFISSLNRFGQDQLGSSFSKKIANTVLRATGLNAFTEARRRAYGVTQMHALGSIARKHATMGHLDPKDAKILEDKGVTDTDFGLWKAADHEDWGNGNTTMLTPESIYRIPDAAVDNVIAPKITKLRADAQKNIDELNDRNSQDQTWAATRANNLRQWVQDQQAKLAAQAGKADEATKARLNGIAKRLGALYDQIDVSNSFFTETKKNQVSLTDLRRAGVSEGRNQAATDKVATALRTAMRETAEFKGELDQAFVEKFAAKEQEINALIERGDEQKVAFALDKFDQLFDEANAKLTDRLEGADERLGKRIKSAVASITAIREHIKEADALWQKANVSRPSFGKMRAQGVREGKAREASANIKRQIREITSELAAAKKEKALDFAERWAAKKFELDEFTKRADERMKRRDQVVDRMQREIQPAIERARVDAREKAVTRLLGMVLEETDVAVVEPGAKERAFMGAGIQRGTWKGELTHSFFLFKSFPIAMLMRHWARAMSQETGKGKAKYLAALIASTTVLGAISMQIKEVLAGRDPRNLNPFDGGKRNWLKAMLQGGSLGLYGDFLFSESTQHGQSPVASFLGPVVGLGEDIFKMTQGNIMQSMSGKDAHFGAEAVRFLKGNLPGGNLWYTKAAMDHLIWNQLAEYFSPGYLAKVRKRAQTEFHQSYWWDPADVAPDRAPDMAAMAGEQ